MGQGLHPARLACRSLIEVNMKIAIITGSGLEDSRFGGCEILAVETDYGRVHLEQYSLAPADVYLLPRHGRDHAVPPHRINYRANIAALASLGCQTIVATNAVGSLRRAFAPGDFVLPDQFIDCTKTRESTFFDGRPNALQREAGLVAHVDVTEPYCPAIRDVLQRALKAYDLPVHTPATYLCTEGPRFETPAEIKAYAMWGASLVGMTGVPEVVLARELGLCYASLCLVTNYAAGMTGDAITGEEIGEICGQRRETLDAVLLAIIERLEDMPDCACRPQSE